MVRSFTLFAFALLIINAVADSKDSLETSLKPVYGAWRGAMLAKNYKQWKGVTAYARQVETRNTVVSQKKSFPRAMFAVPMKPPTLDGLKLLSAKAKGPTATAVYFGKVDFNVGGQVPDSLLVLHFLKEGTQWKFYTLTMMNQLTADVVRDVRAGRLGFLKDAEFQPSGRPPRIQKECPKPDYISDIHLIALGFDTEVVINGISTHGSRDDYGTQLVMGGLRKGKNTIQIKSKKLGRADGGRFYPKVTVHVRTGKGKPASKVFEFKPDPAKGPFSYTGQITVDRKTIAAGRPEQR